MIFKQKNKDNFSPIKINRGEVGKIIKKLDQWDYALVDFSIEIPLRFKKLNTTALANANTADTEAIFLLEEIEKKKFIFF